MQVNALDHVNLRTTRLDQMINWYVEVLELVNGPRPNFPFPGAWIYAGERAIIHLVAVDGSEGIGAEVPLKLEHFALSATGEDALIARLEERGERFERAALPDGSLVQYNLWDPDGNHIHVDFAQG